jgi:hypothetical protein
MNIHENALIACLLMIWSSGGLNAASVDDEAFRRNVEYAVTFAVTPDADGRLIKCTFDSADTIDPARSSMDFRASDAFVAKACAQFADRRWTVIRGLHDIQPA